MSIKCSVEIGFLLICLADKPTIDGCFLDFTGIGLDGIEFGVRVMLLDII